MTEKTLDQKFSKKITSLGYCQLKGLDNIQCYGGLDPMHIITRGRHVIRWDTNNAICGCRGHHRHYTDNPNAWREIVEKYFIDKWDYVQLHKNDFWDKDLIAVNAKLDA